MNCQSLVHGVYRESFGLPLPIDMMSSEMFAGHPDFDLFVPVNPEESLFMAGDLFFFGKKGLVDYRKLHVTVNTGKTDSEGDPLILHATKPLQKEENGIYIWPFRDFFQSGRYEQLYGVRRLREDLHKNHIQPFINLMNTQT